MPNLLCRPAGMSPRVATHCGALVALAGGSEGRSEHGRPAPARSAAGGSLTNATPGPTYFDWLSGVSNSAIASVGLGGRSLITVATAIESFACTPKSSRYARPSKA